MDAIQTGLRNLGTPDFCLQLATYYLNACEKNNINKFVLKTKQIQGPLLICFFPILFHENPTNPMEFLGTIQIGLNMRLLFVQKNLTSIYPEQMNGSTKSYSKE